jgi:hypothetical protein
MALKSVRATANIPGELQPLIDRRMRDEKYPSLSAYIVGLILFDLYARRKHLMTAELMRQPQWVRDQIIQELVENFDKPDTRPGSWFEHRIEELVAQNKLGNKANE